MFVRFGDARYDVTRRALVMAILNRTPDSFFDAGRYWDFDSFLREAEQLVTDGADILDVGGVKAGPGPEVTPQQEIERVVPAVEALRVRFDLPISVDTFRAAVLEESLKAGAVAGNDISGFADPGYLKIAADYGASVVATHVRLGPRIADPQPRYANLRAEVLEFLQERAQAALSAGIDSEKIMIDAGLDLGKTAAMSAELMRHTDDLVETGFVVLLSASNKGFLGELTGTLVNERTYASLGAHALGITLGARVLRVHNVAGTRRVADTMSAMFENRRMVPLGTSETGVR